MEELDGTVISASLPAIQACIDESFFAADKK